ncbi:hypothetical protein BGS_0067 [Beggiatoa sp. SS]|nr:hypothetical protein BGS_0067 [Beggiatoa sp. SS]
MENYFLYAILNTIDAIIKWVGNMTFKPNNPTLPKN